MLYIYAYIYIYYVYVYVYIILKYTGIYIPSKSILPYTLHQTFNSFI